jgi:uncharacterized membrane protein
VRATFSVNLILWYDHRKEFCESKNYEAPHYAVFSTLPLPLLSFLPFKSKYVTRHPVLPQTETPVSHSYKITGMHLSLQLFSRYVGYLGTSV